VATAVRLTADLRRVAASDPKGAVVAAD
jgi:hypothetical protein